MTTMVKIAYLKWVHSKQNQENPLIFDEILKLKLLSEKNLK